MAIKNEKGGALILVVLVIVIFSILGLTLMTMNGTRSKHVAISEKNILATNMAEIGMKNADKIIRDILRDGNNMYDTSPSLFGKIESKIKENRYEIDGNYSFSYKIKNLNPTSTEELLFELVSTGEYMGKTKEIHTTFDIKKTGGTSSPSSLFPSVPGDKVKYIEGNRVVKGKVKDHETWDGDHYINGNLYFPSNTELRFKGKLYVSGKLTQDQNTNLLVYNDAHIKKLDIAQNKGNQGNLGFFCTEGTLYYYGSSDDIKNAKKLENGENCENLNDGKPINGIYAKNFIIVEGDDKGEEGKAPFWHEPNLGVETEYK